MFIHGFGHLVDRPVFVQVFVPMFVHGFGHLVDGQVFVPVFVHGIALLVDGPVFEPVFVHGIGLLVDSCKALGVDMRLWLEGNGVPDAVMLCLPLPYPYPYITCYHSLHFWCFFIPSYPFVFIVLRKEVPKTLY